MKSIYLATAAIAAAVAFAVPASAVVYTTSLGTITVPPSITLTPGVNNLAVGGDQLDYTFTLASALTLNSSNFTSAAGNGFTFTNVTLFNSANLALSSSSSIDTGSSGGTSIGLAPVVLATGSYRISVTGTSTDASSGVGSSIRFSAAPEPATWGLMVLGFGAIGGALRTSRRKVVFA